MIDHTAGKHLVFWVGVVLVVVSAWSLTGCSSNDVGAPTSDSLRFEREVLHLSQGASLEDVEADLGKPVSKTTEGDESIFHYRSWQLRFQNDALYQRIYEARGGKTSVANHSLDRKILLRLMPGMTVRAVRRTLGAPEAYERIYESTRRPTEVLRYAYWELYFQKERLVRRTRQ